MLFADVAVNSPGAMGWLWVIALVAWIVRNVIEIIRAFR